MEFFRNTNIDFLGKKWYFLSFSLVFSVYLQIGLGYSPLRTGLASAPQAAAMIVGFIVGIVWYVAPAVKHDAAKISHDVRAARKSAPGNASSK